MPEHDRDRSLEHVLRHVLTDDGPASPEAACLDAETLAAWTSGSLRATEASAAERHVAGCARCRAMMAVFLDTTAPEPVAESLWRRWRLSWVVPLATAATAAALWVLVPGSGPVPVSSALDTNANAVRQEARSAPPPPPVSEAPTPSEAPAPAASPAAPPALVPPAAAPAQKKEMPRALGSNEAAERADVAKSLRESPASPSEPAAAEALANRAEADLRSVGGAAAAPPRLAAARQAVPPIEIVSPDGSARWRLVNGQQVEHWTRAGAQWTAVLTSPDVLIAGASPSPGVCWIVGRSGAVYITANGTQFVRLPFREMADLVAVVATDAQTATISASDGRSWRTTDGGRTWSQGR